MRSRGVIRGRAAGEATREGQGRCKGELGLLQRVAGRSAAPNPTQRARVCACDCVCACVRVCVCVRVRVCVCV